MTSQIILKPCFAFFKRTSWSLVCLLLMSCSGGGTSLSAIGSGGSGVAQGLVTGFGSVFVDGVELEDANASVVTEQFDGTLTNSVVQMGQRVRVVHDGNGNASRVTIDASVIGAVSAISGMQLSVAGQKVNVNNDLILGAITIWAGGYSTLADVHVGDLLEVHGSPVYDSVSQRYSINATRIQKVSDNTARVQVSGTISALDPSAKTLAINGLTINFASSSVRPAGTTLSNGIAVTAYGPLSALTGMTLLASHLKINRLQDTNMAVSAVQLSGQVSKFNSANKTFELQGTPISLSSATLITPVTTTIADMAYVKVIGTLNSDASVSATSVQVREQSTSSDLATIKLSGLISDWVSNANFMVRGVPVDASGIVVSDKCPGVSALTNGLEVQVTAIQQANTPVVYATNLSCKVQNKVLIRPMVGLATNVDTSTKIFVLSTAGSSSVQSVQWSDNTTFLGLTPATLANTSVRVEGYLNANILVARTIANTNVNLHLDDEPFRVLGTNNGLSNGAWMDYHTHFSH
jgi:hypothetical protein